MSGPYKGFPNFLSWVLHDLALGNGSDLISHHSPMLAFFQNLEDSKLLPSFMPLFPRVLLHSLNDWFFSSLEFSSYVISSEVFPTILFNWSIPLSHTHSLFHNHMIIIFRDDCESNVCPFFLTLHNVEVHKSTKKSIATPTVPLH